MSCKRFIGKPFLKQQRQWRIFLYIYLTMTYPPPSSLCFFFFFFFFFFSFPQRDHLRIVQWLKYEQALTRSQSLRISYSKVIKDWGKWRHGENRRVCQEGRKKVGRLWLPLMQRALVKSFSYATGNESVNRLSILLPLCWHSKFCNTKKDCIKILTLRRWDGSLVATSDSETNEAFSYTGRCL